jgi:hypothetical protein
VAEKPEALISILCHGLTRFLWQDLASRATVDAVKPLLADVVRLWADLHGLQVGAA